MQALTQDSYGEAADVLRVEEIAQPLIGDGEVLLRVHAASSVDRGCVWHLMTRAAVALPVRLVPATRSAPPRRASAAGKSQAASRQSART